MSSIEWGKTVDGGCETFATEDGAVGFLCHVGTNDLKIILRRLERLPEDGAGYGQTRGDAQ